MKILQRLRIKNKWVRRCLITFLCLFAFGTVSLVSVNCYVKCSVDECILTPAEAAEIEGVDCILVPGCLVYSDGTLSDMLRDRVNFAIELYKAGAAPKILVSGDHGQIHYDEVSAMKNYMIEHGVPSEDIFMDHAGFSTYETVYRASEIFGVKKVMIATQEYHLYRALYIAEAMGMEAYGVCTDGLPYIDQFKRDVREVLARCKDFAACIFKPEPTYLGDAIPIGGNGDVTND